MNEIIERNEMKWSYDNAVSLNCSVFSYGRVFVWFFLCAYLNLYRTCVRMCTSKIRMCVLVFTFARYVCAIIFVFYFFLCLSLRPSVSLSIYLTDSLFCLVISSISVYQGVRLSINLSDYLLIYLTIYQSI